MAGKLEGKTIAFLVANEGVEQVELTEPWKAVEQAGGTPELISLEPGTVQAFNHLDKADTFDVDHTAADADAVALRRRSCCPAASPTPTSCAPTRTRSRSCARSSTTAKPVAAICHGPWTLIDAGVVKGRTLTSWPSLRTDLRNAGATWVDEEVHVDEGLVTSRNPDDLPAFCAKLVEEFCEGRHEGQRPRAGATA